MGKYWKSNAKAVLYYMMCIWGVKEKWVKGVFPSACSVRMGSEKPWFFFIIWWRLHKEGRIKGESCILKFLIILLLYWKYIVPFIKVLTKFHTEFTPSIKEKKNLVFLTWGILQGKSWVDLLSIWWHFKPLSLGNVFAF
jgi:hypothetical protein